MSLYLGPYCIGRWWIPFVHLICVACQRYNRIYTNLRCQWGDLRLSNRKPCKHLLNTHFSCPQTKLWEGNIFTPVCHYVHGGRGEGEGGLPWTEIQLPQTDTIPWTGTPSGLTSIGGYASYWNTHVFHIFLFSLTKMGIKK